MNTLWTLQSLADAAGGRLTGADPAAPVSGLSIDSRTLAAGDAFFAIRGVRMDGHRFVPDALAAGAAAVIVAEPGEGPRLVVPDPLAALAGVGAAARARLPGAARVIAVTGSVGKTGTKEMLRLAFAAAGRVHASPASFNNQWGVPLSLARMPADTETGVFEIGMNHAGEIEPLARLVRPHIAIVTAVEAVHLEFFDSVAAIAEAKAEIFAGLEPGGTAIIPADNPHTPRLAAAARARGAAILTFGTADADVSLTARDEARGTVEARVAGRTVGFEMGAVGPHIVRNALAVLAALHAAGADVAAGAARLARWTAPKGRGRRVTLRPPGGDALLLDDAYNANPASMGAAIEALGRVEARRRVAILGDMLELGATSDDLHRGLAPLLVDADTRIVHTVGTMIATLRDALPFELRGEHAATADEFVGRLPAVEPGDAVLVKASLGTGLGAVVAALEARYGRERHDA